jgi:2-hydroxy-3-oxopropionate reductase
MRLGFIGLGRMGLPMARRLLGAEYDLVVHDANPDAVAALTADGAQAAGSPRGVADSAETVLVSLPTPQIVQSVALGANGVAGGSAVRRFIDLSTTGVPTAKLVADALAESGVTAIDSPVSGGVSGAAAGTLAMMVACPDAEFEVAAPILSHLGRVFHVGQEPGLGQTMKLLNNYLSATALVATSEAMVLGAKAGLDPQTMIDVLNAGSGRNSATQDKFPRSILPGKFDFGFAIGLMCKDLRLFAEQAESMGVPLWVGSASRQLWQYAADHLGADSDFTTIIKPLEEWAQVQVRAAGPA